MRRLIQRAGSLLLIAALAASTDAHATDDGDSHEADDATKVVTPDATPAPAHPRYGLSVPSGPARPADRPAPISGRGRVSPYHATKESEKSRDYYRATWGVDKLRVVYTMSGNLIRFSFRVVEPKLAHALGDHELTPQLYSPKAHAYLQVPTMAQVGPLRQLHTDKADEEFWLLFSNKGNLVRKGDRVDVIIGKFHADGLVVE